MQSTYKRIIVYDLETGGKNWNQNSITEIAMVAVDVATLEVVDKFSVVLKPRLDLSYIDTDYKALAKSMHKNIAQIDPDTKVKTLKYKGQAITNKNWDSLVPDIKHFHEFFLGMHGSIITWSDYQDLLKSDSKDIAELFYHNSYNPEAFEVTHMNTELLLSEGVEFEKAFILSNNFIKKHTVGNSKPILAGHFIRGFDNHFMAKFFEDNKIDLFKIVNSYMIDTYDRARERWTELPSFSLSVCANEVGLTLKQAHRALPDTEANAQLLIKMLRNVRGEGSQKTKYKRKKYDFKF